MSLNSIQLTSIQVAELYPESLVLTENQTGPIKEDGFQDNSAAILPQATEPLQFLGKNRRKLVILVHYPSDVHLSDQALEFLSAILKACQLTLADVAIVNLARQQPDLIQLVSELAPEILISFGVPQLPAGIPGNITVLTPASLPDFPYMTGPSLDELNQPQDAVKPLKRQLWEGLKSMLGI